jgi:conjugative transposon TraK protein
MFQKTKNIDAAFRSVRVFSLLFMGACCLITGFVLYKSYALAASVQDRIYILAGGKALEAFAAERKDNIGVEARDHVKMFHHWFFSLDPDDKVIEEHLTKALYLGDGSVKRQYDNLKENGYYANLISANISQEIREDSIQINTDEYPFYFRYQGVQKIIRPSTITTRSLITEGFLRHVSRSDHNPHGFIIEKWRTIQNRDQKTEAR